MAKKVFISYSHDEGAHSERVRKLADSLRTHGVECLIDQYEQEWLQGDGALCMQRWIEDSDFVLLICTETYKRRIEKKEALRKGQGAKWEGLLIRNTIYGSDSANAKFIPVLFETNDAAHIPLPLQGARYFVVEDQAGFEQLYWVLRGENLDPPPPVGPLSEVPPRKVRPIFGSPGSSLAVQARQNFSNFPSLGIAPNLGFVGREVELLQLRSALFPAGTGVAPTTAALTQAFTGEGGIGKSQLAQRFAERTCKALGGGQAANGVDWDLFDCVWWLDCSKAGHARAARDLAEHLGHTPPPTEIAADSRRAIRVRLDPARRHLLILDNLEAFDACDGKPASEDRWGAAEGWTLSDGSRLLVTTREQHLPRSLATSMPLHVLSKRDARTLLRGKRPDLQETQDATANDALAKALDAVTEHLGCHALAVDLARAWLDINPGDTPATLLGELKKSDEAALALFEGDIKDQAHRYSASVASTLALHMDPLAGTPAEQLLYAAAFAAPDRIPAALLMAAAGVDAAQARAALEKLASKNIVHHEPGPDHGLISLHRLTQMVVRARLAKASPEGSALVLAKWFEAIHALHAGNDHDEIRPRRTAAAPHVTAIADRALDDCTAASTHRDAALCHRLNAEHLQILGDLPSAAVAIDKAVRWAKSRRQVRDLMAFLARRAIIRQLRGDVPGAAADLQDSIDWGEAQSPRDGHSLAIWYASRAGVRQNQGNLRGAEEDIEKSIEWTEAQSPRDDCGLAVCYALRARIRQLLGNLPDVEAEIQKSIAWGEAQSPRDHYSLAIWYSMRAEIRVDMRDFAGAEADVQKSIDWGEAQLPRNERSLAICYATRAKIRRALGDLPGAEADIQWSIDWGEAQSPRDERALAICYSTRAVIHRDLKRYPAARADINAALKVWVTKQPNDVRVIDGMREIKASIDAAEQT